MNLGVQRFDYRVIAWLCLATGLTLIPFALHHAALGDELLFTLTAGLAVLLTGVALRTFKRGSVGTGLVCTILVGGNLATVYAIYFSGDLTIYWAFPVVAANLVFLQPRAGLAVNIVFAAAVLVAAGTWAPLAELSRIAAALFILITCVYCFSYYITQQQEALRTLAAVDPLTGAGNRRALHDALEVTVQSLRRYGCSASLVVVDLDHFKRVNDTHGHDTGDQVLRDLVQLLKRRLRNTDRLFRYGGEEFVIVTPHTPLTLATQLAEDLRRSIAGAGLSTVVITASLGVAELQSDETADEWLKRGDQALYEAKAAGRNRTVAKGECSGGCHDPDMAAAQHQPA